DIRHVLLVADLVDLHDARMMKLGRAASFAEEAFLFFLRVEIAGPRHFDGDGTIQFRVAGLVDHAEGAAAEQFQDLEFADGFGESGMMRRGDARVDLERAAAVLAGDFLRLPLDKLNAVAAVGTFDASCPLCEPLRRRRSHLLRQPEHRFHKLKPACKRLRDLGMSGYHRLPVWSRSCMELVQIFLGQRFDLCFDAFRRRFGFGHRSPPSSRSRRRMVAWYRCRTLSRSSCSLSAICRNDKPSKKRSHTIWRSVSSAIFARAERTS